MERTALLTMEHKTTVCHFNFNKHILNTFGYKLHHTITPPTNRSH